MQVRDRKKIARLMVIQELSTRQLAKAVGWKSHTLLLRILRGDVRTVEPTRALALAKYLGVPVDDLFMTRLTTNSGQTVDANRKRAS